MPDLYYDYENRSRTRSLFCSRHSTARCGCEGFVLGAAVLTKLGAVHSLKATALVQLRRLQSH